MRLLTVVVLLCVVTSAQAFVKIGEFVSPIQSDPNIVGYFLAYGDDYNPKSPNDVHGGVDWKTDVGTKVYSIADGEVVLVSYNGWTKDTGWRNFGLVIRYKINGKVFYVVYGHLACPPSYIDETLPMTLKELQSQWLHQRVKAGDVLGAIGKWGSMPHLHFGIYYSDEMPTNKLGIQQMPITLPWTKDGIETFYGGWVNPIDFLESNDICRNNEVSGPILASGTGSGDFYFILNEQFKPHAIYRITSSKIQLMGYIIDVQGIRTPIALMPGQGDNMVIVSKIFGNYIIETLKIDTTYGYILVVSNRVYQSSSYVRAFPFDGSHSNPILTFLGYKAYDYKTGKIEFPSVAMNMFGKLGVPSMLGVAEKTWQLYHDMVVGSKRTLIADVVGEKGLINRRVFRNLEFDAFDPVLMNTNADKSVRIAFNYKDSENTHVYSAVIDGYIGNCNLRDVRRLCASNGSDRVLSRLSSSLIIRSDLNGKSDLFAYNVASGNIKRLTHYNEELTFSK